MILLKKDETLQNIEIITHGNMNLTFRLFTNMDRSFIVKQGRNFVEKYPDIEAPIGRTTMESLYLKKAYECECMRTMSPKVLGFNQTHQILILEDLGEIQDGIHYYRSGDDIPEDFIAQSILYLNKLHHLKIQNHAQWQNQGMRELNAFHMFEFPFIEQGKDFIQNQLPELNSLRTTTLNDAKVHNTRKELQQKYLSSGTTLVHGDFYPGSWVAKEKKLYVIDPEFCFAGYPEFDWGVLLAHITMLSHKNSLFVQDHLAKSKLDHDLIYRHGALEILRRLFGVAQLPFDSAFASVTKKAAWVQQAIDWLSR